MNLPLYEQGAQSINKLNLNSSDINLGLYYQKFCKSWKGKFDDLDKKEFINEIAGKSQRLNRDLLDEHTERMCRLTCELDGRFKIYELTERFLTGIGLDHPVEVGFLWDHTLGVPYIAGSSIKGIVKDWAKNWCQEAKEDIKRIFGSDDNKENQVGSVIFFDALPYGMINLATDIITPHYSPYYSQEECPGDWTNPTPIPFLTVDKNQKFIFFIAPRTQKCVKDYLKAIEWLEAALTTLGAGAKTATGYGCFTPSEETENAYYKELKSKIEEEKRKRKLENMSPIQKEMEQDGYSTDSDIFMENLTVKWLKRLEEDGDEPTKREIAKYLAEWYKTNKSKQWKKPKGKNIEKVNLIKGFLD
jgi:CRISPR-associated protein Cmr6